MDDSLRIARAHAQHDDRFHVTAGPHLGVVAALNTVAARARGVLWLRMDADDRCAPDRFEKTLALAADHPDVDFFSSRVRYFPAADVKAGMQRYEDWLNSLMDHRSIHAERFVELPLLAPSWALRPALFEKLGGYREGDFPEDYEFFLRAVEAGARFAKHPDVLLECREHGLRTSKTNQRFHLDRFHDLRATHLAAHLQGIARPLVLVGAGPEGKRWAKTLRVHGLEPAAFLEVHPGRIGQTIQALPVHGYDDLERFEGAFLLGAVARPGGRRDIRARLVATGRIEEEDFLFVN
jgi:glycosyltransferase involved in cell wall biosynthesis